MSTRGSFAAEFRDFLKEEETSRATVANTFGSPRQVCGGVRVPAMRAFTRKISNKYADLSLEQWVATLEDLYSSSDTFHEIAFAGYCLAQYPCLHSQLDLQTLGRWISNLHGWAEVDITCQSTFRATELLGRWDEWSAFLTSIAESGNISQQRASVVLLLRSVRETEDKRLYDLAIRNVELINGNDYAANKLISKAVSWILRTLVKNYGDEVTAYMKKNETKFARFVVREFYRKAETGRK